MGGAARARGLCNKKLSSAQVFFTGLTDQGHAMGNRAPNYHIGNMRYRSKIGEVNRCGFNDGLE